MVEVVEYNDFLIFGSEEEYNESVFIYKDFSKMCWCLKNEYGFLDYVWFIFIL